MCCSNLAQDLWERNEVRTWYSAADGKTERPIDYQPNPRGASVLGSWGNTTRGAVRNKERWKMCHTPTQDPSTNLRSQSSPIDYQPNPRGTSVLGSWGNTTRGAVRNKEWWKGAVRLPKILVLACERVR